MIVLLSMEIVTCFSCQNPKAPLVCGICKNSVCKNCVQFVDEDQFSFASKVSQELKSCTFCEACYSQKVVGELEKYEELMGRAKAVDVFHRKQIKETRFLNRKEKPLSVTGCDDHDEAILRLAFLAAEKGFNTIIDVEIQSKKVALNKYQTTQWSGTAIPLNLNPNRLVKDRSTWENPN